MTTIATLVSLLPIFFTEYQEIKLISELNKFFDFDHNIFILESSVDINRYIDGRRHEVTPKSVYVFKNVGDNIITELKILTEIRSKNVFTVVVPRSANFGSNLNLLNRLKEVQRLHVNMKIGMFFPHSTSKEDLQTLFKWCKKQLIVNIFVATYSYPDGLSTEDLLNVFTFHPFGTFEVINVTGSDVYKSYFQSLNSNFYQHQLRLEYSLDFSIEKGFWLTVFRLMNASFIVVLNNYTGDSFEKGIEVSPRLYANSEFAENYMYPLVVQAQVIIVPEALPYSEFSAYLRTLTSDAFFGYSLIIIAAVILLLSVIRYNQQKKILFFQSVTDVLNLLMNDNMHIKYQRLYLVEVFLIVPLTFMGLVIVNGILSNLQSYLTRPVLQPQIKKIEDIYKSPFPILTDNEKWKDQLIGVLTGMSNLEDWNAKVIVVGAEEYYEQINMFNRSMSFITVSNYANILIGLQKRINIKGYHNPRIQFSNSFFTYNVFDKFVFFERLNEIVHRIQSAGLYDLWCRQTLAMLGNNILKTNYKHFIHQNETVVGKFEFPTFIVYGWFASVIVLVIEIIWKNFELSRMKNLPRMLVQKLRLLYIKVI